MRVVYLQDGLSLGWSLISVASHQDGLSGGLSSGRVVSSGWSVIRVVSHENGLSSGWSLIRQDGLSSG